MINKYKTTVLILSVFSINVICDSGTPLFLSPYIENGTIDEAKRLSEVNSSFMLNIKSYSGFITVNNKFNSNIWFWYFPVEGGDVDDAPLVIWLQGGPVVSSMYSLFQGVGPFYYHDENLTANEFSWHKNQSMLFIDNPIGAGFSFTEDEQGYSRNQSQISENLYSFLIQFLQVFPELQSLPLFLTGQSYAGKHIPSFAHEIHTRNPTAYLKINLKGMAIGNAWFDPPNLYNVSEVLYQLGFVDSNIVEYLRKMEETIEIEIKRGNWSAAKERHLELLVTLAIDVHLQSMYNYITDSKCNFSPNNMKFIESKSTRKVLHVGEIDYNLNNYGARQRLQDQMQSVKPLLEKLLDEYPVVLYNGQLDLMVPYVNSEKVYRSFNWSYAEEYRKEMRQPFIYKDKLAGYLKIAGNFEEILIRNVGHCVALEEPELLKTLITAFTHDTTRAIKPKTKEVEQNITNTEDDI